MLKSTVAWLDFSNTERQKMLEVIRFFQQRETRDELGLGSIRNLFAEMFFPGTTTLQTRARYYLFIPWLYQSYENRRLSPRQVRETLLHDEIHLVHALQRFGETDGIIGSRAGSSLHRFPSSIYWNGLQSWGILLYKGLQHLYHTSLPSFYQRNDSWKQADERELADLVRPNWDPALPPAPSDFPNKASFLLREEEATYLIDRLQLSHPESLLAFILQQGIMIGEGVKFPWLLPDVGGYPDYLQERLQHARNFSETMVGASLLYNLMLAELTNREDRIESYHKRLNNWRKRIKSRLPNLQAWNQQDFWALLNQQITGRVPPATRRFVQEWLKMLLDTGKLPNPIKHHQMRELVRKREIRLKRSYSRFTNQRNRDLWSGDAGTSPLEFRWDVSSGLINDILLPLTDQ